MVNILSSVVALLSAVVAVQSAALPEFIDLDDIEKRSPNPNPLMPKSPGAAIIGKRHYIYDGVKLVRTADPIKDPEAAGLHKRYASRLRFLNCKPFGQTICGTCFYNDISYDTATCIPTPVPDPTQFIVFEEMTNAYAQLYTTTDCTGGSYIISGCTTHACNSFYASYGTKSVMARVGCSP
ncbi:hypothetical protein TWF694_006652 [Orbilia ellipsospora]|uniref:Uncharacterized protein n=1 Tax=Orbilia ellipsospora TaxID=2528407 RepID=A0AAV9XKQ0_9PEZI